MANSALSSGDLARYASAEHALDDVLLAIIEPQSVATAIVSATPSVTPIVQLSVSSTSGWSDVQTGMLVRIARSGEVLAYTVVRKAPTSNILYIGPLATGAPGYAENIELAIESGDAITIYRHFPLWPMYSTIQGNTFYKLWDLAYSDQNSQPPPVANTGPWQAARISSGTAQFTLPRAGVNTSFALGSASIASYLWTLPSGVTLDGGYASSDNIISVHADPGAHLVTLTVTDSNGKSHTARCWLIVDDGSTHQTTGTAHAWTIESDLQTAQGREIVCTIFGQVVVVPGAALVLREWASYSGESLSTGAGVDTFVGYVTEFASETDGDQIMTRVTAMSPAMIAAEMAMPSQMLEEVSSPTKWTDCTTALSNPRGALYYVLKWHLPAMLDMHDFYTAPTSPRAKFITFTGSNVYANMQVAAQMLPGVVGSASDGTTVLAADPMYLDSTERNAIASVMTLSDDEIKPPLNILRRMLSPMRETKTGAFAYEGGAPKAWYAIKRWYAGTSSDELPAFHVTAAQGVERVKRVVGHHMARLNREIEAVGVDLLGLIDPFDPAYPVWYTLDFDAAYDGLNEGISTRALVLRVTREWDREQFAKRITAEMELESFGQPGEEVILASAAVYAPAGFNPYETPIAQMDEEYLPTLVGVVNTDGQFALTFDFAPNNPVYIPIASTGDELIADAVPDYNSAFFTAGYDFSQPLGVYFITTEGTSLRIYRIPSVLAGAAPELLHTATMNDTSVGTTARIETSDSEPETVLVSWRDQTGTINVRTTDGGDNWSSNTRIGDAITDSESAGVAHGVAVIGNSQYVCAPNSSEKYRVYLGDNINPFAILSATQPDRARPIPMMHYGDRLYITRLGDAIGTPEEAQDWEGGASNIDLQAFTGVYNGDTLTIHHTIDRTGSTGGGNPGGAMRVEYLAAHAAKTLSPFTFVVGYGQRAEIWDRTASAIYRLQVDVYIDGVSINNPGASGVTVLERFTFQLLNVALSALWTETVVVSQQTISASSTTSWTRNGNWVTLTFNIPSPAAVTTAWALDWQHYIYTTQSNSANVVAGAKSFRADNIKMWTSSPGSSDFLMRYDGSDVWTDVTPASSAVPLLPHGLTTDLIDAEAVHVWLTNGDYYQSSNRGGSWTLVDSATDYRCGIVMSDLVIAAGNSVGLSTDGGDTFADKTGNLASAWGGDVGTIKRIWAI